MVQESPTNDSVNIEIGQPLVGVVVVNYNAGNHLVDAVASLGGEPVSDIVVVDNGSTDNSIEKLQKGFPDLNVVHGSNVGFGKGNNLGVANLNPACDVFVLLNPDTVVHKGAFEAAIKTLMNSDDIGIVGARLLNLDGSLYPSARAFPHLSNAVGHGLFSLFWPNNKWSRRYKRLDQNYDTTHNVDWVSGAAMFIKRDAWESIGGFDDSFFMYFEDTDLCWRVRQAGWRVVYEPAAQITHVQGVSTGNRPYRMLKEHHRSAIRYNFRTARGIERLFLPMFALGLLARLPLAWVKQWRLQRAR